MYFSDIVPTYKFKIFCDFVPFCRTYQESLNVDYVEVPEKEVVQSSEDGTEEAVVKVACGDDVWDNPVMGVVLSYICASSADEVKFIRPGSTIFETYALVNAT